MPIGVPRIIYCWGEELPAQWTDIYNFIFRRRMVFLMQYLDDELCNQICGLLINIHMEDRSKELEKKEMERSGVFKSSSSSASQQSKNSLSSRLKASGDYEQKGIDGLSGVSNSFYNKKSRSMEDLLNADEDLGIDEIDTLEQYTLQKITTEWLNWNAQFFDYSDEPYLYYLADLLSKDFNKSQNNVSTYSSKNGENMYSEISKLLTVLKNQNDNSSFINGSNFALTQNSDVFEKKRTAKKSEIFTNKANMQMGEVYSAFRTNTNFSSYTNNLKPGMLLTTNKKQKLLQMFQEYQNISNVFGLHGNANRNKKDSNKTIFNLLSNLAQKDFSSKLQSFQKFEETSEKILSQKNLRRAFSKENNFSLLGIDNFSSNYGKSFNYINTGNKQNVQSEFRDYYRKQTERALIEEESKKVFVIINSFGGSVGNGITVHDALQFIKAGSLTLALGVAASAASLALAGGTIGERYVTEGCHVMIHQPESSLQGQASDIWIDSQEIMKIRLDVAEIYSLSTYRPRHKILRDLDRDFYLTATETIQYGLADEIASNDVMHDIIEMTNKVWDYHDSKQQRLLESRESASSGLDTQTQN